MTCIIGCKIDRIILDVKKKKINFALKDICHRTKRTYQGSVRSFF